MAIKLRRGLNADRITITPESGEPLWTTDTKLLYIGDGTTVGGNPVGGGTGDVVGPSSSVNNRVVFFDGTTGKLIKDSGLTLSPAALTRVNDTNVILTLGGAHATSLLAATSLTLGWTGQLSTTRGGTGLSALGTSNQLIRVNSGATALEYFTPTYITTAVTSVATAGLISGGTITGTGTITTSMSTGKLVGRSTSGTGIMEEISIGTGLTLSSGILSNSATYTSPLTTKGDIFVRSTVDTRLPVGIDGQILTANSSVAQGLSWQDNYADWTSVVKHTVKNNGLSGTITKGTAVYVTGSDGTNMLVGRASNTSEATSSKTMGLMQSDITTTGGTQTGFVVTEGLLGGLNTAGTTAGDPVWLGVSGALIYGLINKPYAPAHLVFIGIVTKVSAGSGEIFVKVQNGFELKEIHDVDIITTTPINGHILGFDGTLWVNKTIAGWLGFTPGTVTSVTGTAPIVSSGGTAPAISIPAATTSADGYLTAADWTTFNGKQNALSGTGFVKISGTTISYDNSIYLTGNQSITLSGDVSGTGPTAITTTIGAGAVTLAKMANLATGTIIGNNSGSTGIPLALTSADVTEMLNLFSTAATTKGLVPGSNGVGSTYFLNADGAWAVPAGSGGMSIGGSITSATAGSILFAGTSGVLAQDNANFFWNSSSKRLGIGTNTPSTVFNAKVTTNDNVAVLEQDSNATTIAASNAVLGIRNNNTTANTYSLLSFQHTGAVGYARIGSIYLSATEADFTFQVRSSNVLTDAIYIKNTTNVIIGGTTDSGFKFDVVGTARASTSINTPILRGGTSVSGNLTLSSTSNATKGKIILGSLSSYDEVNDRLGIGVTNPQSKLWISDNASVNANLYSSICQLNISGTQGQMRLISSENTGPLNGYSVLTGIRTRGTLTSPTPPLSNDAITAVLSNAYDGTSGGGGTAGVYFYAEQNVAAGVAPQRISFVTSTTNNIGRTERLTIKANGNVLIGTTTDSGYKLDVNGTVRSNQFQLSALNTAPATSTSTGTLGEIRIVNGFIYVCVATNTWQRAVMTTF